MKMFLGLMVLTMSFMAFAENNYIDAVGTVKTRVAEYVMGVNGSAGTLAKGSVVCFDNTDDNGIHVDVCVADGAKAAGVTTASCAVGARCKLLTKGFIDYLVFDYDATSTATGGMLYSTNDAKSTVPASVTTAMFPIGVAFDAVAADGSIEAFIDI